MTPEARELFHELANLSHVERDGIFTDRGISAELRAEVESLLRFDAADSPITMHIASAAAQVLESPDAAGSHGPYRLLRLLGSGGMGSVWLAERADGEIRQQVAVKVLRAGMNAAGWQERFLRERQLLASLNHPAIAHVIDAGGSGEGHPYLVMEYVDGAPIDDYAEGKELREQLALFLRVCDGIMHAHQNLIIHRDLKPSNILVDRSGQPKILDFGIAKILDETAEPTQTIDRLLTPSYASPEQLAGERQTTATDVYSLGAVLYKIVTGRTPHETGAEISAARRLNPSLPSDIDYILRKALRREPEERYASVEAFANDIRALLDLRPVQARSGDAWYRARRFLRRHWLPAAAAAITVAGLSTGLYVANHERGIAQRRFQQVRQLSRQMIDLDGDLRSVPGTFKARTRIVSDSLEYLGALSAEARGDKQLSLELGEAYLQVARLQGVPSSPNLGKPTEAEETLTKSDGFVSTVLAVEAQNRRALIASAEIAHDRMVLASVQARTEEALAQAKVATTQLDRLLSLPRDAAEIELATHIYQNVGIAYENAHRFEDAIQSLRRALDVSGSVEKAQVQRSSAYGALANTLRQMGDLNGALEAIQASVTILEKSPADDYAYWGNTANALIREALILAEDGDISLNRPEEAIAALQKASEIAERAISRDPNDYNGRHLLASASQQLGNLLRHRDPVRALAVYDHAITAIREVKNSNVARSEEALLLANSSYAARWLHREVEATDRIESAFRLLREIKEYPADKIQPPTAVDTSLRALADDYAETGRLEKAAETYQELLEKIAKATRDPNEDLRHANYVSRTYGSLADILRRLGRQDEAASLDARRAELWQHWDRKLPNNLFVRRQIEHP